MRLLSLIWCAALVASAPGQSLRLVTNKKQGFRVRLPAFLKEVPPQPNERGLLAKFKGTKDVKIPAASRVRDANGKRIKSLPVPLEVWVVRLRRPDGAAPITPGRKGEKPIPPVGRAGARRSQRRLRPELTEFLQSRIRGAIVQTRADSTFPRGKAPRGKAGLQYTVTDVRVPRKRNTVAVAYTVRQRHEHYGDEIFGLVFLGPALSAFDRLLPSCVRSLQRLAPKVSTFAKADPYANSELRGIPRRRAVRGQLVKGWYALDTENFILVTDLTNNTGNRQLLRDMCIDLETMRSEYAKRFPPIKPLEVISTVRVCNSYDGYLRYSSKPGTGGYWHPVLEELVLFNPVGKIRAAEWMRRVTPKAILYHEAMHQYFHYANGQMPPAPWFNEGYGEYFGAAKTDRFAKVIRTIGKNEFRWQVVRQARRDKRWPELKRLLQMPQRVFYSQTSQDYPVLRNYAFAWAFCYFLEKERAKRPRDRDATWAALPDAYLANLRAAAANYAAKLPADAPASALLRLAGAVQRRAFEQTFKDVDFAALQADWIAAMKSW